LNCNYCGSEIESPVARYTESSNEEKVTENVACSRPECIQAFFQDLKKTGMMNPESWDTVEMFPRPPEQ
jgi:hypothetical protein